MSSCCQCRTLLWFFLAAILSHVECISIIDGTRYHQPSLDPEMDHALGFSATGELSFFWKDPASNKLKVKFVHVTPSTEQAPSYMAFGIYDNSAKDFGSNTNVFIKSDWVVGTVANKKVKKYLARNTDNMGGSTLSRYQTLPSGSVYQFPISNGRVATVLVFEKLLQESNSQDIRIHPSGGEDIFLWAEGPPGSRSNVVTLQSAFGAFNLDLGLASGVIATTPQIPTPAPTEPVLVRDSAIQLSSSSSSAALSTIALEWENAHNSRRMSFYETHGVPHIPVKWSEGTAASAQGYANKLIELEGCTARHKYQGDSYGGENLFIAWTPAGGTVAPETALKQWYDDEASRKFLSNLHFMQVAWRGTKYVGCGMASKDYMNGLCHIAVCRYVAPGNCNVRQNTWLDKMLEDSSPCPPKCPPEGCAGNVDSSSAGANNANTGMIQEAATTSTDDYEEEWISAHNVRRQRLFREKGVSNVDLKWSTDLRDSAQRYANILIQQNGCNIEHGVNGDSYGGENLALAMATPGSNYERKPVHALEGWFEREMNLPYPQNGHLTQVAWRSTQYVGCGQAKKFDPVTQLDCYIQVCRYLKPGNCNVIDKRKYEELMLADNSPCGPSCPADGCSYTSEM